jgi:hypothetical protein
MGGGGWTPCNREGKPEGEEREPNVIILPSSGNHSAGKSSFINWYVEEHVQRTGVSIVLGPPGCAQVFPYLSPGPLDLLVICKITNKPHASRNYTQDQLSVHTAAENDRCK